MQLQERIRGVLEGDRGQNIDALKAVLRCEASQMLGYYMIVEQGPEVIVEQAGKDDYIVRIAVRASRLVNVGKRIV